VACPVCGSLEGSFLFTGRDLLHKGPGCFQMVQCEDCEFIYLNPRPSWRAMQRYYPQDYAPYTKTTHIPTVKRLIRSGGQIRKRSIVEGQVSSGTLLDVGCASGEFLQVMADRGHWDVFGLEPNSRAASYAEKLTGAKVYRESIERVTLPKSKFDVITMWHVLEHLYKPKLALTKMRSALRSEGKLIVAVPIADCLDAKLFGKYWSGYDIPRHLGVYSRETLRSVLLDTGFKSVTFESFIGGFDSYRISINFWLEESFEKRDLLVKIYRIAGNSLAWRILMIPYFTIVNAMGLGSTLVAVASR
jgi:SAM-dependent methyltransferase